MKTHRSILSLAVLAGLSTGAQAGYDPATTAFDLIVRMSGATAVDNGLFDRVDQDMCQQNANKSYLVVSGNSTSSLPNYWGIACDASAASGVTGKVLFLKRSAGGSGVGVGPVNDSTPIAFLERASCTDTDANNVYTCPTLTAGDVPDGGISDIQPEAFLAPVNGPLATSISNLDSKAVVTQVFGIVVNTSFRNALQAAQFGSGSACVGDESEKCMPSLTKQQINSIFATATGMTSWGSLRVDRDGLAGTLGESLTGSPATAAFRTAPFDTKVHICRRVKGSGTQAQFNANFLAAPQKGSFALTPYDQSNTSFSTGPIVWNGSGSADVETCLEAYETGTTKTITSATGTTTINPAPGETGPTKAWAIGIQGGEKNNTLQKAYRFIKVDGVAPTLENVWNGKYFDFAETSCQTRVGDTSAAATFIKNACNLNVASVTKLNLGSNLTYEPQGTGVGEHTWGVSGYLMPSTIAGATPDGAKFVLTNPVTNYVRFNKYGMDPVINPTYKTRIPYNSGDTSLDTNNALDAPGTGLGTTKPGSSW